MTKSEVKIIPNEIFFQQVKDILGSGESVSLRATGRSMAPTFRHKVDTITVSPFKKEDLKVGSVVLFDRGDAICVHRIIEINGNNLVIRGDGNSYKSLEYARYDKVLGLVTAGTFRGGKPFTIEDESWRSNTEYVFKHAKCLSRWHYIQNIFRRYYLSMLVTAVILVLSFIPQPPQIEDMPICFADKIVHSLMYLGASLVFWFDWLRCHAKGKKYLNKGFLPCMLLPIIMGALIELGQAYLTQTRSGEVADCLANIAGVLIATLFSYIFMPYIISKLRSHKAFKALPLVVLAMFLTSETYAQNIRQDTLSLSNQDSTELVARPDSILVPVKTRVKPGIEVLEQMDFAPLKGKRVGLVTNPSGVDHNLRSTIDILHQAPQVNLVALFGPEHGIRGDVYAGGHVADAVDPATGLPVFSLYGPTRKPTTKMLEGIDVMVYDIQDVGVRGYTFISTMGLVMEACAALGIEVIILDRPNPLGGEKMEGCYVEQPFNSFVSQYRIPYVYGLTPGELAMMINEEGLNRGQKGDQRPAKCKLQVIPMEGWHRDMLYEDTGLPWVLPSPNIPYAFTAPYYAMSGPCGEIYNYLQVGLSYTIPFQVFAASWIEADKFMEKMQSYQLPGISFRPIHYKPFAGSQAGKLVSGVQLFYTDYKKVRLTEVQFYVIQALAELYPTHLPFGPEEKIGLFNKICGTDFIKNTLSQTYKVEDILPYWRKDEEDFRARSAKYMLYL